jgi:hypothetical protein
MFETSAQEKENNRQSKINLWNSLNTEAPSAFGHVFEYLRFAIKHIQWPSAIQTTFIRQRMRLND